MKLRFVSFFAGIGGIDLGLERAGHECVGQVEINEFRRKVLAKHWPYLWRGRDITKCTGGELPESDLWTAGFPCQEISNAGTREGIHGKRSGLFFEFMRLVRTVRPRYLLLENVAALLVRGMGDVLGELASCGYDAEWDVLPACALGAPHLRERVFVLAYAQGGGLSGVNISVRQGRSFEAEIDTAWLGSPLSDTDGQGLADGQRQCSSAESPGRPLPGAVVGRPGSWWEAEPTMVRVVHGVPDALDRVGSLGNAVVPQMAELIGDCLMELANE